MKLISRIPELPNASYFAMNRWFFKMHQLDLLFHPDDPAETIVVIGTGKPTFTEAECIEVNYVIGRMFECHGDQLYEVVLKIAHEAMGINSAVEVD